MVEAASAPVEGTIADAVDLDGVEVWLGSTLDTEGTATDRLLAAITRQALEAGGADVRQQADLGGGAARDALTAGEIDLYWEGAGDAWTAILRQPAEGLSGAEIHDRLADRDLQENGVAWLDPLAFDDGPRFAEAADPDEGEPVGSHVGDGRADEHRSGRRARRLRHPDVHHATPRTAGSRWRKPSGSPSPTTSCAGYEPEPVYPETADGTCRFGVVESTSGRVAEYDLAILEDDVGAFLPNPPTPSIREDLLVEHPDVATVLNALAARLDADELREMNRIDPDRRGGRRRGRRRRGCARKG